MLAGSVIFLVVYLTPTTMQLECYSCDDNQECHKNKCQDGEHCAVIFTDKTTVFTKFCLEPSKCERLTKNIKTDADTANLTNPEIRRRRFENIKPSLLVGKLGPKLREKIIDFDSYLKIRCTTCSIDLCNSEEMSDPLTDKHSSAPWTTNNTDRGNCSCAHNASNPTISALPVLLITMITSILF